MIDFPTNWGAKEPQNLPNHRVVIKKCNFPQDGESSIFHVDSFIRFTG